jgi:hypothetical protein
MSEDQRQNDNQQDDENGEDRLASTPFDNPFFLPVLLLGWAGYCAFDILRNAQAYQDNPKFNEWGLVITGVLGLYFTWKAIKEKRAEREKSSD